LKIIRRRKTTYQPQQQSLDHCVEVRRFGFDGEMDGLRREKQVLIVELVKPRQQQQHNTKDHLQSMENRQKKTINHEVLGKGNAKPQLLAKIGATKGVEERVGGNLFQQEKKTY